MIHLLANQAKKRCRCVQLLVTVQRDDLSTVPLRVELRKKIEKNCQLSYHWYSTCRIKHHPATCVDFGENSRCFYSIVDLFAIVMRLTVTQTTNPGQVLLFNSRGLSFAPLSQPGLRGGLFNPRVPHLAVPNSGLVNLIFLTGDVAGQQPSPNRPIRFPSVRVGSLSSKSFAGSVSILRAGGAVST